MYSPRQGADRRLESDSWVISSIRVTSDHEWGWLPPGLSSLLGFSGELISDMAEGAEAG